MREPRLSNGPNTASAPWFRQLSTGQRRTHLVDHSKTSLETYLESMSTSNAAYIGISLHALTTCLKVSAATLWSHATVATDHEQ